MAHSSLLGGDPSPRQPSGTDVASLGPSDLSDSGSDSSMGALDPETLESDSDSLGTGERASIEGRSPLTGADILPDHLELARRDAEPSTEDALQHELDFDADADEEDGEEDDLAPRIPVDGPDDATHSAEPDEVRHLAQDEDEDEDSDDDGEPERPASRPPAGRRRGA